MIHRKARHFLSMLAIVAMVGLLCGCGPQKPMQRLGGTLPPTKPALPPGIAAPALPPGEPGAAQSQTDDAGSSLGVTGEPGQWPDLLFASLYERPHSADGSYLPALDLIGASLSVEGDWVFVTLLLSQAPAPGVHYSVEFDTDLDGRPDMLVTGYPHAGTAWDSQGMRAYLDPDKNVGGDHPRQAEPPVAEWDGFEVDREDAATAQLPLIWLRPAPSDANAVQMAVSFWMLGAPSAFAWRGWSEGSGYNPGKQEYNDFHSLEAAGSPYPSSAFYPSRSLVAIDNTCVMTYGFELDVPIPGYCGVVLEPLPPGRMPPDDLVYGAGEDGVTLTLGSERLVIPGGILGATPAP